MASQRPSRRPAPAAAEPRPSVRRVPWEQLHQRFTCWLPRDLVVQVRRHAAREGESISAFVTRAVRSQLDGS